MADIVSMVIAFDNGEMTTVEEYLDFCSALITSGLVNSTGSYQRFAASLIERGLITPDGDITDYGREVAEHDKENS